MSTDQMQQHQRFKPREIASKLPDKADTLIIDEYLTNEEAASARVFRVYGPTPPHFHAGCDEYLYVLSGRGTFWIEDVANLEEFSPGDLLYFKRNTVHALPDLLEEPVAFLSFDIPRREPTDIIFVNPEDGNPESFIANRQSKA